MQIACDFWRSKWYEIAANLNQFVIEFWPLHLICSILIGFDNFHPLSEVDNNFSLDTCHLKVYCEAVDNCILADGAVWLMYIQCKSFSVLVKIMSRILYMILIMNHFIFKSYFYLIFNSLNCYHPPQSPSYCLWPLSPLPLPLLSSLLPSQLILSSYLSFSSHPPNPPLHLIAFTHIPIPRLHLKRTFV